MESEGNCTPPEFREIAEDTVTKLLPKKPKDLYTKEFENFERWCSENNVKIRAENVVIASDHKAQAAVIRDRRAIQQNFVPGQISQASPLPLRILVMLPLMFAMIPRICANIGQL
ncbi:hypothetical protein Zmor_011120 [Zophobas morio]|uniref:Uncharacterized protein n=1 Tax=Zophobas morio TaxID=2755281 RepID=A0AA38IQH2_9CUCU|nr:hypothetical protein Zmor_011120 [Zophobas morio]